MRVGHQRKPRGDPWAVSPRLDDGLTKCARLVGGGRIPFTPRTVQRVVSEIKD